MDKIEKEVFEIFRMENPNIEEKIETVKLSDLGINSISFIKIIVALEEKFNFEFDDEDLDYEKFEYFSDLCAYINNRIS